MKVNFFQGCGFVVNNEGLYVGHGTQEWSIALCVYQETKSNGKNKFILC